MYYAIGASVSSLHRESTDSLIVMVSKYLLMTTGYFEYILYMHVSAGIYLKVKH